MTSSPDPIATAAEAEGSVTENLDAPVNLEAAYEAANVQEVLNQLDTELIGLRPVKTRIREIAALLVVERARKQVGLTTAAPSLHMSFTGRPGTGAELVEPASSRPHEQGPRTASPHRGLAVCPARPGAARSRSERGGCS